MFQARAILMVLIAIRLLMPPGICVCKLTSPASRYLVALLQSQREIPIEPEHDDGDHDAGCPASPLAAGMGVQPPSVSLSPPTLALDLPADESAQPFFSALAEMAASGQFDCPQDPLYLTLRALLI